MRVVHSRSGRFLGVALFAILLLAQTASFAHTFEHDAGSVGDTACATCISLSQIGAATVDSGFETALETIKPVRRAASGSVNTSRDATVARQRGPPQTS